MKLKILIVLLILAFTALNGFCTEAAESGDNITDDTLRRFAGLKKVGFDNGKFFFNGFVKVKFENTQNEGENSSLLRSYADLDFANVGTQGLSLHFSGSMQNSIKKASESLDLYYAFIRYKTFEDAIDVSVGRIEMPYNNFMTLDGGLATFVTPYYFGVSVYGGVPFYKDFENRKEVFRNTGDLLYGGRIFLSGIESATAYIGYSKETGKDDSGKYGTFRELVSAGATYKYNFTDIMYANAVLLGEYDIAHNVFSRASARLSFTWDKLEVSAFGDIYDVLDTYPKGRELIIQILSNGNEKRAGGNIAYNATEWLSIYGGAYVTEVMLKNDSKNNGAIYKAGFDIYLMKYIGLIIAGEYYMYDTNPSSSQGASLSAEWRITQDLLLYVSGEFADLNKVGKTATVFDIYSELTVYLLQDLSLSAFYEKSSNNRFLDDMRCGMAVRYGF